MWPVGRRVKEDLTTYVQVSPDNLRPSRETVMFVSHAPRLSRVELLPELQLYLFDPSVGLFDPAGGEYRSDRPPPFWGFAWAGGQAVARYVLDHPETVRGRRVLDLACGSGVVAVAAAKAGAAQVRAVDVDPAALAAVADNARANGVRVEGIDRDVLSDELVDVDVVLAGDVFYSKAMADRVDAFLRRAMRAGMRVLVGDPGRGYLKSSLLEPLVTYDIPVLTLSKECHPSAPLSSSSESRRRRGNESDIVSAGESGSSFCPEFPASCRCCGKLGEDLPLPGVNPRPGHHRPTAVVGRAHQRCRGDPR